MTRFIGISLSILLAATGSPADDASVWPPPANGDLHHLCYADGLPAGQLFLRYHHDQEKTSGETLITSKIQGLYGVSRWLTAGIAVPYHEQTVGDLHKTGPGDATVQLRAHGWLSQPHRLRAGVRLTASLPTGYDEENPQLDPFTSRTHDYLLEGLLQWKGDNLHLMLSPGAWLPGKDKSAAVTAALGFDWHRGFPLGIGLRGEYVSRYDLVADEYFSAVFGGVRRSLFWGFGLEFGAHRDVLAGGEAPTTWSVRLSKGRQTLAPAYAPRTGPERLFTVVVEPPGAEPGARDPNGFLGELQTQLYERLARAQGVMVQSGGEPRTAVGAEPVIRLHTDLLRLIEGNDRGLSIPHILATPRATVDVTLRITLRDGVYGATIHETVIHKSLHRGTGMEFLPVKADADTWVPPPAVRRALRQEAAKRLARCVEEELAAVLETVEPSG
ncbi:MAG: hypothetical protein GF355_00455 [Candidatus Eisenbacteria bacterium]|nr:hypothetical protein [Candidatus Eisenbacteria bacterium]